MSLATPEWNIADDLEMPEMKAILLGRMSRHDEALRIYVYRLEDYTAAETYVFLLLETIESDGQILLPYLLSSPRYSGSINFPSLAQNLSLTSKRPTSPPRTRLIAFSESFHPTRSRCCPRIATATSDNARSPIVLHPNSTRWDKTSTREKSHEKLD